MQRLGAWVQYALRSEADDFTEYVKNSWLSGQAMNRRTGELYNSVKPWTPKGRPKKGLFSNVQGVYIRPGVGIPGTLNYLGRYIGTEKEFMIPAFEQFTALGRVQRAVEDNVAKMLDKVDYDK